MPYLVAYAAALVAFVAIDAVWLGTMAGRLYKPTLGDILLDTFAPAPAAVFYLAYPAGLVIFAIAPALRGGGFGHALLMGALFGLFTYGTYDLTNHATLRNWTTTLTVVDMAWGTLLGAASAAIAYLVASRLVG